MPRSGLKPNRSNPAPKAAESVSATTNMAVRITRLLLMPAERRSVDTASPAKLPNMNTSPCAKLITRKTPKKSVKPTATRVYMPPIVTALTSCCVQISTVRYSGSSSIRQPTYTIETSGPARHDRRAEPPFLDGYFTGSSLVALRSVRYFICHLPFSTR